MSLSIPQRSKYLAICDINEPERRLEISEATRFFNAFGYVIDEHFLRIELRNDLEYARITREVGERIPVARCLELINQRHSWLQRWRTKQNEKFTALWIADRLETSPVDVMRILQTSSEVMAKRNNKTGAYYVREADLETIRNMLVSVPESQRTAPASEDATGGDQGDERKAPDGVERSKHPEVDESDEDRPPLDDYDPTEKEYPEDDVSYAACSPFDEETVSKQFYRTPFVSVEELIGFAERIIWTAKKATGKGLNLREEFSKLGIIFIDEYMTDEDDS